MVYRIDPKTRRLIVTDLTPSIKGDIITLQEYADNMLWTLQRIQEELQEANKKLDDIKESVSNLDN